jgi:hypothetical protein
VQRVVRKVLEAEFRFKSNPNKEAQELWLKPFR